MNDELIQHIIANGLREVIEEEPVEGGARPIIVNYTFNGQKVIELNVYAFPPNSDGWSQELSTTYELLQVEGYETIEI